MVVRKKDAIRLKRAIDITEPPYRGLHPDRIFVFFARPRFMILSYAGLKFKRDLSWPLSSRAGVPPTQPNRPLVFTLSAGRAGSPTALPLHRTNRRRKAEKPPIGSEALRCSRIDARRASAISRRGRAAA